LSLCRLRSGPFELTQAAPVDELAAAAERGELESRLVRPVAALGFAALKVGPEDARRILHGGALPQGGPVRAPGERIAALDPTGTLIAILEVAPDRSLQPLRVLGQLAAHR
jgi:tRNA U55 pseudouridine synthase TruB